MIRNKRLFIRLSLVFNLILFFSIQNTQADDLKKINYTATIVDQNKKALIGASVEAPSSEINAFSDENGNFALELNPTKQDIIIEYPGIEPLKIQIDPTTPGDTIVFNTTTELQGVEIIKRRKSTEINMLDPIKAENIGIKELSKAACCNLSESFETTPSIDVGFTDAVSGYKQISLLGLAGPNVLFTRENIPDTRGLANITGLTFTPGVWVESIQLSKGTGSVVNGYEGVAGQINVELHKPNATKGFKLLANAYQSGQGRTEGNLVYNHFVNDKWNTTLFAHIKSNWLKVDENKDGFMDQPKGETAVLGNRWMYANEKGWEIQLGAKAVWMNLWGGSNQFEKNQVVSVSNPWGFYNDTKRGEVWAKIGKVNIDKPYQSMGLQLNAFTHSQNARYGLKNYTGDQNSFYANYIFQTIIGNTNHTFKAGASFQYDDFDEEYAGDQFSRAEIVPGIFTEYTYNFMNKFAVVAGLRGDYHNLYGAFVTPRLHVRYAPEERLVFRASVGRAQRTVNIFAENIGFMASNRSFELPNVTLPGGPASKYPFGMKPEVAWNMGINATKQFMLNYRDGAFSVDYYYTNFENMVVTDIEQYNKVQFYNLNGQSYAHSFQAQLDYEVLRKWDWRFAYRWYDVKTTYEGKGLIEKPLLATHRFFINTAYETKNKWNFDFTANWTGAKRMPEHIVKADGAIVPSSYTDAYWIFNTQISKTSKDEKWRVYGGVENLLNTMQHHLILGAEKPYNDGFDAGLVWGSAMGRNFFVGVNYQLK